MSNRWVLFSSELVLCWFLVSPFTFPLFNTNPQQLLVSPCSCTCTVLRAKLPPTFLVLSLVVWVGHWQPLLLHRFCLHSFKGPWSNCIVKNLISLSVITRIWLPWWSWTEGAAASMGWGVCAGFLVPVFCHVLPLALKKKKKNASCTSEMIPVKNEISKSSQISDVLQLSL